MCNHHAHCIDTVDSYECECNRGFSGNGISCRDVDECSDHVDSPLLDSGRVPYPIRRGHRCGNGDSSLLDFNGTSALECMAAVLATSRDACSHDFFHYPEATADMPKGHHHHSTFWHQQNQQHTTGGSGGRMEVGVEN